MGAWWGCKYCPGRQRLLSQARGFFCKTEASFASQLPSGSQVVAALQTSTSPASWGACSIWAGGQDMKPASTKHISLNQFPQLFSQGIHFVLADTYREDLRVHCRSWWPESLCHLTFPCWEREYVISRELGLCGSSRLPPPLYSPPFPLPQIHATLADILQYARAQREAGKPWRHYPPAWGHSRAVWPTMPRIAPGRWVLGLNGGCKRTLSIHVLDGLPLVAKRAFII